MRQGNAHRTVTLLLALVLVPGIAAGCKSAFRANAEAIAANIGRNADDVERGFKAALPGATEEQLEVASSQAVSRTKWIKSFGQRVAVEWEEQATLRAVAGGTCDVLDVVNDLGDATTSADVENVIRKHIRAQGLAETDAKVLDVAEGVLEQLQSIGASGSVDQDALALSLACLPF
jgi:hypothetical protein